MGIQYGQTIPWLLTSNCDSEGPHREAITGFSPTAAVAHRERRQYALVIANSMTRASAMAIYAYERLSLANNPHVMHHSIALESRD